MIAVVSAQGDTTDRLLEKAAVFQPSARELDALIKWASTLDPRRFDVIQKRYLNQPNCPPQLIAVRTRG